MVLNVEKLKKELDELKKEADELQKRKEQIFKKMNEIDIEILKIKDKEAEEAEEVEKLTSEQIDEIDINDLFKINNIFGYSIFWQMRKDDWTKYKIIKITNNFIMAEPLKLVRKEFLNECGGYATYKSVLIEREEGDGREHKEKKYLKISKNNLKQYYFFKDGLRYELNKEFEHTDDNGR